MTRRDYGRDLLRFGILLFLLGLLTGLVVPLVRNSRMGLSAHLEGILNGMFLVVLGLAWERFTLTSRGRAVLFGLALYGTFTNWATTLLAAVLGTSRRTPIAGAGFGGRPWQEALVDVGLFSLTAAMVGTCALVLWGLRKKPPVADPERHDTPIDRQPTGPER